MDPDPLDTSRKVISEQQSNENTLRSDHRAAHNFQ